MNAIRAYLRQIAGYLILSVLVENFVAKKEYGPYIRLFLNLLLVLLFVSPILSISAERVGQSWLEAAANWSEGIYLESDLKKLNEKQTTIELSAQTAILKQQIGTLVRKRGFELVELSFDTDAEENIIQINSIVQKIENSNKTDQSVEANYKGVSYGEEIEPVQALRQYLSDELSTSCKISVEICEK